MPVRAICVDERAELPPGIGAQSSFDDAIGCADEGSQFSAGVDIELLVDVDEVRGDGTLADAKSCGDLAVGEAMHDVTDDFALAIAELLIEDCFHFSVGNEIRDARPVGVVLAPHEGAELVGAELLEQVDVVKLLCVFDGHGYHCVFVVGGEDFSARRAGESHDCRLDWFRHGGMAPTECVTVPNDVPEADGHIVKDERPRPGSAASIRRIDRTKREMRGRR